MRVALFAGCLVLTSTAAAVGGGAATPHEKLFQELGAETESVRVESERRLETADDLTVDEVRAALKACSGAAKPLLLRVAAARSLTSLVPDVVEAAKSTDPAIADAAARALVALGDDAVGAGVAALAELKDQRVAATRIHLKALAAKRAVERAVLAKWQRKAGTYEGRFSFLAELGWPVQPVLLAMLLDVPLTDQDLTLPETDDAEALTASKFLALRNIALSSRRGYVTFDPLPTQIEPAELFDMASQALGDVADIELMSGILEQASDNLKGIDAAAGQRLRPIEKSLYRTLDEILFERGLPSRLEETGRQLQFDVQRVRHWAGISKADLLSALNYRLEEYARVLHKLKRFDEAAAAFSEIIRNDRELSDKEPAIVGYNRACALAQAGRTDEAIKQLDRALDHDVSSGWEDLTRQWVTEDGDLRRIHDDPRFKAVIRRRFDD